MELEIKAKKWLEIVESSKYAKIWGTLVFGPCALLPILGKENFFNLVLPIVEIFAFLFLLFYSSSLIAYAIISWKEGEIKESLFIITVMIFFLSILLVKGSFYSF